MRKKIRTDQGHVEGYGGPGYYWARVSCDNILLASIKTGNEGALAVQLYKEKQKWSKNWTVEAWAKAIRGKKPASALCGVCGGDTLDGATSCVGMTFCKKCHPRIEEFIQQRREKDEAAQKDRDQREAKRIESATTATCAALFGAFHWTGGWHFKRTPDGSVRMMKPAKMRGEEYLSVDITIPAAEWASIVCSVSAGGETGERWEAAQDFHGRALKKVASWQSP